MKKETDDFWGYDGDDLIVDRIVPDIVSTLAKCEKIDGEVSYIEDVDLCQALNLVDVEEQLMDCIVAIRKYQKRRDAEIKAHRTNTQEAK